MQAAPFRGKPRPGPLGQDSLLEKYVDILINVNEFEKNEFNTLVNPGSI